MNHASAPFASSIKALSATLLGAACLTVPALAHAESRDSRGIGRTHIAVDFDMSAAVKAPEADTGGGGALRIGRELDLFLISLTPEVGGSYHSFGGDDRKLYSGFVGGRLGVGKIIEPSIFAHVGVARLDAPVVSRTAARLDGGLALDFTLLPLIDIGVHGAYNVVLPRGNADAFKFVTVGLQAALVL